MQSDEVSITKQGLLTGRRILVTGGARGLGLAFARHAGRAGAAVVIADILADELHAAAEKLRTEGIQAHSVVFDQSNPASVTECATQAAQLLGGLDGLVNNAAITNSGGKALSELDIDVWDKVMAVNVRGTWLMSRACWPALKASGHGSIVNLASDTSLWGAQNLLAYVASKGAVIAMSRSMAREMGVDDITVNAVAPGLTLVEATEYVPKHRHELYENQRAIQRQQMPDDVSGVVTFLLSDLSRFVTGQVMAVNGGFVMH
ncbi:MAG: short-chain dehydrogenase [Pusillimonas sp.]|nr:short-chain dehydrogenase [Pusillimonas sp.]MBC43855.1 short-chain dehydrogenase [Pusillimonas sp.]HCN71799.1 short-chain dehydrogenase [Pusillimonas sp.]